MPPGYEDRYKEFYRKIQCEETIDWELIDHPNPKSIVAALIQLQAAYLRGNSLQSAYESEEWRTIWESAVTEHNSLNRSDEERLECQLDWNNKGEIQKRIEKLQKFLSDRQA